MDTAAHLEALKEKAYSWDLKQWTLECKSLSPNELASLIPLTIQNSQIAHREAKLALLFHQLPINQPNEAFAQALNTSQIIELMDIAKKSPEKADRLKLSALFTSISPGIFKNLLAQASPDELIYLREEAFTEAIQHHLTLFTNELSTHFDDFCTRITKTESEIAEMDLLSLNKKEITSVFRTFENFQKEGREILNLSSKALALAWNANRLDLIQELGKIKELCQKCLLYSVGNDHEKEGLSGLYLAFSKKVDQLFSDIDSRGNINPMADTLPALEALVKFSVWYIKDYFDIGLLPKMGNDGEEEDQLKREHLFAMAEKNLVDIGLKTLADIKAARIYSKQALIEYIEER